ncbi:MAG: DUF11 domain-containing protein [Anaerolineae bacterium]|nr:DUF11 domain-containing protein [Anaerolineae bacterium]
MMSKKNKYLSVIILLAGLFLFILPPLLVQANGPIFTLTKSVDRDKPHPGQRVTYMIVVNNNGAIATNAVISDTLDSNLTFAGPVTLQGSTGTVAQNAGDLPRLVRNVTINPNTTITVTFPVTVNSGLANGLQIANTAAVTSSEVMTPTTGSQVVTVSYYYAYLPVIFKALDGWLAQTSGTGNSLYGIGCKPYTSVDCVVGGQAVTLNTSDGGDNWSLVNVSAGLVLYDVSCPTAAKCVAVGKGSPGVILVSNDGGKTWPWNFNQTYQMNAVDCPSATQCVAVGEDSEARVTDDGGQTWINGRMGNTPLYGVDCFAEKTCWMVGLGGRIIGTYPNPNGPGGIGIISKIDLFTNPVQTLMSVSCVDGDNCVAVGTDGVVAQKINGGAWTPLSSGTTNHLNGVSCSSTSLCFAVGANGTILRSNNGGSAWSAETSPTTQTLNGIDCIGGSCIIVGTNGTILRRH